MNTQAAGAGTGTQQTAQDTRAGEAVQEAPSAPTSRAPAPTVWPTLQARDALALIDFLVEKIGFERTAVHTEGDRVVHAQLSWPEGGGVMLGSHKPDGEWSMAPGTFGAYVVTDDVDGLYERVKAAGVTVRRGLTDQEYGNRDFTLTDPEGNLWCFGVYRGEPRN